MTHHNAVKYIKNAPASFVGDGSNERMGYLCRLLDNPQKKLKYIRLAGTNGKSICAAMLSSVLTFAGYNVCVLNMSEADDPRDNIKLNCTPLGIPEFTALIQSTAALATLMKKNVNMARAELQEHDEASNDTLDIPSLLLEKEEACELSKSEILLIATLIYCKNNRCDICIIESSNTDADPSLFLPPPFAAVICGAIPSNDKRQIMRIKNYIKRGISEVVSAPEDPAAYKAISDTCAAINCRLSVPIRSALSVKQLSLIGSRFVYGGEEYRLSLCGRFQTTNAITTIETLKLLRRNGYKISSDAEKQGLAKVKIASKFEVLSVNPTMIADSTYKNEAVETVCESLFDFSEITGRNISLCLPCEQSLIQRYLDMLEERGYTVTELFVLSNNEIKSEELRKVFSDSHQITVAPNAKALSKLLFAKQNKDSVLLISGQASFTNEIRTEVVRRLQF